MKPTLIDIFSFSPKKNWTKKKEKQVELATAINEEGSYEDKKITILTL